MLDRLVRLTLVGVFSTVVASGTVFADAHEGDNPCGENPCAIGATDAIDTTDDVSNPCAENPCGGDAWSEATSESSAKWPIEIIDRPLTLPQGAFSVGLGLNALASFDVFTAETGGLWGLSYGVTDEFSIGLGYDVRLDPDASAEGTIDVNLGYTFLTAPLTLTATGSLGYNVDAEQFSTEVGIQAWYNVTPKIALISAGNQLNFAFDPTVVSIDLPIAVGFQAMPNVFLQLDTTIGNLDIKDSANVIIFDDFIPVALTGYYSLSNALDIGATVGFSDLKNDAGDNFIASLMVTYYGGVN